MKSVLSEQISDAIQECVAEEVRNHVEDFQNLESAVADIDCRAENFADQEDVEKVELRVKDLSDLCDSNDIALADIRDELEGLVKSTKRLALIVKLLLGMFAVMFITVIAIAIA